VSRFTSRFSTRASLALLTLVLLSACQSDNEGDSDSVVQRMVSVTLATVKQQEVQVELHSIGRLVSMNTPLLAAEINARVVRVLVEEGQPVQQNQVLILLDTTATELTRREAAANIEQLKASIANEERRVARYQDLKTKNMMSQERLDDAEAKLAVDRASMSAARARLAIAEDRLSKAELISPVNGVVERRHISVGDYVKAGSPMVTVTDTQDLRAQLPFPETVGHQLVIGQPIVLESPIAPGLLIDASIDTIRPQVGAMSRALMVIANLENPGKWRPEATVEATVIVERRPDAVVVPLISVVRRPAGEVVYVLDSPTGQQVRQQRVESGVRQNGMIEIRSGLQAGEIIVADGAHYLSDGASVVVRESQP
jgi:membrane fusion protein (multidrug efflux system)